MSSPSTSSDTWQDASKGLLATALFSHAIASPGQLSPWPLFVVFLGNLLWQLIPSIRTSKAASLLLRTSPATAATLLFLASDWGIASFGTNWIPWILAALPLAASTLSSKAPELRTLVLFASLSFSSFVVSITIATFPEFGLRDLGPTLFFVGALELLRSDRPFLKKQPLHLELLLGLILSWQITLATASWILSAAALTLCAGSYLKRQHQITRNSEEQPSSQATRMSRPSSILPLSLTILAILAIGTASFWGLRHIPFWAERLASRTYTVSSNLAHAALRISEKDSLKTKKPDPQRAGTPTPPSQALQTATKPLDAPPDTLEKLTPRPSWTTPIPRTPPPSSPEKKPVNVTIEGSKNDYIPPFEREPLSLGSSSPLRPHPETSDPLEEFAQLEVPVQLEMPVPPPPNKAPSSIADKPQEKANPPPAVPAPAIAKPSPRREIPDRPRIAQEVFETVSPLASSSLRGKILFTATFERPGDAPDRLYLRSDVLDTVTPSSFATDSSRTAISIPFIDGEARLAEPIRGQAIRLSTFGRIVDKLPAPIDFEVIQSASLQELLFRPSAGLIGIATELPRIELTFLGASLSARPSLVLPTDQVDAFRQEMTQLPLSQDQRDYLQKLSFDVAGKSFGPAWFARRFQTYAAKSHPYSADFSVEPNGEHNIVAWLKQKGPGICSHYAGAFTLLARARGIPTRIVVGYASDEFDKAAGHFIVRPTHAHAWVEYLDANNRWIHFDPTPPGLLPYVELQTLEEAIAQVNAFQATEQADPQGASEAEPEASGNELETPAAPSAPETSLASSNELDAMLDALAGQRSIPPEQADNPSQSPASTQADSPNQASTLESGKDPAPSEDSMRIREANTASAKLEPGKRVAPTSDAPAPIPAAEDASPLPGAAKAFDAAVQALPWLLAAGALIAGSAWVAARGRRAPQMLHAKRTHKLRTQAGRLLAQAEKAMQARSALQAPEWLELRGALTAQRYSPKIDPQSLKALAKRYKALAKD